MLPRALLRDAADIRRDAPDDGYTAFHAIRYAFLLRLLTSYITGVGCRVLDIGPSMLTSLIARRFALRVDTLGLSSAPAGGGGTSYQFDLNKTQDRACWRGDIGPYDVIVMAEVIEHLHTSPALVLGYLATLLAPGGGLIIQTPNAVALHKRIKMLFGRHPYELIRESVTNPGHFREYTAGELRRYVEGAGLDVEHCIYLSYFDYRFLDHSRSRSTRRRSHLAFINAGYTLLPPALRPGITCVARRPAAGPRAQQDRSK